MKTIIQKNLNLCPICHFWIYERNLHHIFGGSYRKKSEKQGLYIYVHPNCHIEIHSNYDIELKLKQEAEQIFIDNGGTKKEFISIFGKSYLQEETKLIYLENAKGK